MAMITELNCNIREAVHVKYLDGNLFSQDVYGNAIRVIVMDGNEPATLAGTVSGTAIREDGSTVALTDSRIDGNVATVVLPAAAYAVPGVLAITIKISDTNTVTTLAYVVANVYRTSTDTVVDPGAIIPSITSLIEQIAEAVASIPADYSSLWAALAETFNASKSGGYAVGEYVTYDGGLYRFKNAHTGSWSSSDVDAVNLGSGIAKNASDISDLKSALGEVSDFYGEEIGTTIYWDWGAYRIPTNSDTVDITALDTGTSGWYHLVVPCSAGNVFHIKIGNATSGSRPWTFIDSNGAKKGQATANAVDADITAPADSVYLVCNAKTNKGEVYSVGNRIDKIETSLISSNMDFVTTIARNTDLNSVTTPGVYRIGSDSAAGDIDHVPVEKAARVIVNYLTSSDIIVQTYFTYTVKTYIRIYMNSSWSDWVTMSDTADLESAYFAKGRLVSYPVDFNSVTDIGTYAIMANSPSTRYQNCPSNAGGELIVVKSYSNFTTQLFFSNDGYFFYRRYTSEWSDWHKSADNSVINEDTYSQNLLGIFRTIGVVGDSLASGQGRINDLNHYHDFYEYSWPQQLKRQLGNEIYNFTESSLSARTWLTDEDHGWALASDGNHDCQCYIIGLGANDVALAVADPSYVGSQSDVHVSDYTQNPDTYYGNYARIISMLKTLEPRAVIFTLTNPAFGSSSEIRDQLNTAVAYMETVFDNVYNIELDAELFTSGYILANKIKAHYTPGAYLYIANYLNKAISKVIHDNPSDFFFVNLIGTEYETPVIN